MGRLSLIDAYENRHKDRPDSRRVRRFDAQVKGTFIAIKPFHQLLKETTNDN